MLIISTNRLQEPYPVYPIGASYLKTYLETQHSELDVAIFDFNLHSTEDLIAQLKRSTYQYIGLSIRNIDDTNIFEKKMFFKNNQELIQLLRKHTSSPIVVGGSGFSIFPKILFEALQPDFGIYSEGEITLSQLVSALETKRPYTDIEGLIYRNASGEIIQNPKSTFLKSIRLKVDDNLAQYYWEASGMLNVQTKRGCPFHCMYCSYPLIDGRKLRTLDIDDVIENIKNTTKKGMNYFFFTDSVFNIDREYNQKLAEKIISSGLKINWGAYFTPFQLEKDELALYKKSGLTHIEFGSDSFSDTQLTNYCKNFRFADIEKASNYCSDLGIFFAHFLILGGFGETESTLDEGFENSKKIKNSVFFPFVGMRVYPQTRLAEIAKQEGLFQNEADLLHPTYYLSPGISTEMIKEKASKLDDNWIFSDHKNSDLVSVFRKRGRKGPLWEYLKYQTHA